MKERIDRHKDGSIKASGYMKDGELEGYWEWFRKDGSKMRSGYFADGKQVGEWTTWRCHGKGRQSHEVLALNRSGLRLVRPQHPRRRRRSRLELRYPRLVFRGEIQQPLFGEWVSLFGETAAAFCLFFQRR
jgi:hypothetical protein